MYVNFALSPEPADAPTAFGLPCRGDLGVQFTPEAVPVLQRRIIRVSRRLRKPVIVATEMLQSMVQGARPTRAEANDVANAVFSAANAVMLSAETATGAHPALAVQMMARIVQEAERSICGELNRPGTAPRDSVPESIAFNAADITDEIGAKALVAYTSSFSRPVAAFGIATRSRPQNARPASRFEPPEAAPSKARLARIVHQRRLEPENGAYAGT